MEQMFENVKFVGKNPLIYMLPDYEQHVLSKNKNNKYLISTDRNNCFAAIPMIAYKVIMPMPEKHDLNLFQLAVLRLMRIRNYSNQELSNKLCIKEALTDLVIKQLIQLEYLTEYRSITSSGEDAVSGTHHSEKNLLGYVFYNVVTNDFEDCFLEEKRYKIFGYKREGHSLVFNAQRDISSDDIWIRAYNLNTSEPRTVSPPLLSKERALNICRSAIKRFYSENDPNVGLGEQQGADIDVSRFSVNVISNPQACYVVTAAYMPAAKDSGWTVSDPFVLKPSETLRQCLIEIDIPDFKKRLNSLNRSAGTAANFDFKEYNNEERAKLEQLRGKIKSVFKSTAVEERFFASAVKALGAYYRLNSESKLNNIQYEREIERYVDNCYQMLEQALNVCRDKFMGEVKGTLPEFTLSNYFTEDIRTNAQTLAVLAFDVMCFSDESGVREDNALLRVSRTSMREDKEERDMQELIAANLILAKNCAGHPFRSTNANSGFITDAAALKTYRDPIRHEYRLDFAFADVKEYLQKIFDYSAWMLSVENYDTKALAALLENTSVSWDLEHDSRLLNDCLNEIAEHGIDIVQNGGNAAIKLLQKAIYYHKKDDADGFIVNAATLFEEILRRYRREVRSDEVLSYIEDKAMLSDQVTVMKELCGDSGLQCLPESLVYFERFFDRAGIFHFKKNPPCSSALFHALICAKNDPESEFAGFIRGNRRFVEDLCFVHTKRGHSSIDGEKVDFDREKLVERLIKYVKQISG